MTCQEYAQWLSSDKNPFDDTDSMIAAACKHAAECRECHDKTEEVLQELRGASTMDDVLVCNMHAETLIERVKNSLETDPELS